MVYETLISEVQLIVGRRSDLASDIGNALRYAQTQREKAGATFPWFLRQTKTITTVASTPNYNLPTGYIQDSDERDGNVFIYSDSTLSSGLRSRTIFLKKMSWKDLQEKYYGVWPSAVSETSALSDTSDTISPGTPKDYALRDGQIIFGPAPDRVFTVNYHAWFADVTLGTGVENNWGLYAPWVLIGEAARKVGSDLENASAVQKAQTILDRANNDIFVETIHREEAGRKRSMGSRL